MQPDPSTYLFQHLKKNICDACVCALNSDNNIVLWETNFIAIAIYYRIKHCLSFRFWFSVKVSCNLTILVPRSAMAIKRTNHNIRFKVRVQLGNQMSNKISLHWCDESSSKFSLVSVHIPSRVGFFFSYCRSVSSLFDVKKVLIEMFVHWLLYVCYVRIQKHNMIGTMTIRCTWLVAFFLHLLKIRVSFANYFTSSPLPKLASVRKNKVEIAPKQLENHYKCLLMLVVVSLVGNYMNVSLP